jgi:hypothetical protein
MTRAIFFVIAVTFGCAHPQHVRHVSPPIDEEAPAPAVVEEAPPPPTVRLVGRRPHHGRFVGLVRATAHDDDFVVAAKQAHANLAKRAEALGATVVQIQRIDPGLHGKVLIAGRAYRLAN